MGKNAAFTKSFQNFAKSVNDLVLSIQDSAQNTKDNLEGLITSTKDVSGMIESIGERIESVEKKVSETKTDTNEILTIVRNLKKERQTGIWDKLGKAKDKTSKVAEGVATIALMAGAILAVGAAFKIVGDVDFKSVVALSIAMPLMAIAFNKIGESGMSPKDALQTSLNMVIMSAGIFGSSIFLATMPTLSIMQMVSAVAVSAAVGVAMYALSQSADEMGRKGVKNLYLLAPLMPVVAAAIAASSFMLANTETISVEQFLSAAGVGIAMGMSMVPLALAAKALGNNVKKLFGIALAMPVIAGAIVASSYILSEIKEIDGTTVFETSFAVAGSTALMGGVMVALDKLGMGQSGALEAGIMMPIISTALVASSWILQGIKDIKSSDVLETALTVAGSTLLVGGAMFAISKMGLSATDAAKGAIIMPIVSAGLMASSWILSVGKYTGGPTVDWAKGFGLSMLASIPAVIGFGALAATGFGALVIGAGILSMLAVAGGISAASHILAGGKYNGGPTKEWAEGVGLALSSFTTAIASLAPNVFDMVFGGDTLSSKIGSIVTIAGALKDAADKVRGGNYTGGPSKEWSEGVGLALVQFTNALGKLKPSVIDRFFGDSMDKNIQSIIKIAGAIKQASWSIKGGSYTGGPKKEWAEGVGLSISHFANAFSKLKPSVMDRWFGDSIDGNIGMIKKLAAVIPVIAKLVATGTYAEGTYPKKEWAEGVGLSMVHMAKSIGTLADEIDPEEIWTWIPAVKAMAKIIPAIAKEMVGAKFDNYPSKDWSKGVVDFVLGMSEFEATGNVGKAAQNITKLSYAYTKLARAIGLVAKNFDKIKKVPNLGYLNQTLITLSILDSTKLKSTLDVIDDKKEEFSNLLKAASEQEKKEKYAAYKNKLEQEKKAPAATSNKNNKSITTGGSTQPTVQTQPQVMKVDNSELIAEFKSMTSQFAQMLKVLNEIADNTEDKLVPGSVIK